MDRFNELKCHKKPRPLAKVLGLIEIIISLTGLIIVICLQIMLLDVQEEVDYIQKHAIGRSETILLSERENLHPNPHTLNAEFTCICDCNEVSTSVEQKLNSILDEFSYIRYGVELTQDERDNHNHTYQGEDEGAIRAICGIHVTTSINPYETKGTTMERPISVIVEEVITQRSREKFTFPAKPVADEDGDHPHGDVFIRKATYPDHIEEYDKKKSDCVQLIRNANSAEAINDFDRMQTFLMSAAGFSILVGFLLVVSAIRVNRTLLLGIFFLDLISIGILIAGLGYLNTSSLCLLDYGGVNPNNRNAPENVQTSITVISSLYIVFFKFPCLVFLVLYADKVYKDKVIATESNMRRVSEGVGVRRLTIENLGVPANKGLTAIQEFETATEDESLSSETFTSGSGARTSLSNYSATSGASIKSTLFTNKSAGK